MGDYYEHYLKKDVLLLADVFEKVIDTHSKYYGLDPCHYFSSFGLSWDRIIKMIGVKLEKISDIYKYLFTEKGLKGGISYIAKRYAKANNKYMNDYEPKNLSTFVTYPNMNNFHDGAMSEFLPYGRFKWLKDVDGFDVNSVSEKSPIGHFLEVNIEYADELYELHKDYLLAPEKLDVSSDMLLKYCKKIADKYEIKIIDVKTLVPHLGNKTKYVLHYKNLRLYLYLGMKLNKVRRVLKFKWSDWMKKYIDFDAEKEKNVANDFEKDCFKLMINFVYGKTMENLRKRINMRLVNNAEDILKNTSKPTYITHKIFGKNYAAIHEIKPVLILNKPIFDGLTALELSKWLTYGFHYNFIKKSLMLNCYLLTQTVLLMK